MPFNTPRPCPVTCLHATEGQGGAADATSGGFADSSLQHWRQVCQPRAGHVPRWLQRIWAWL